MWQRIFGKREPNGEPLAVLLPEPLASQVDRLLAEGEFIEAVRLVRHQTDLNLVPATRAVRNRQCEHG